MLPTECKFKRAGSCTYRGCIVLFCLLPTTFTWDIVSGKGLFLKHLVFAALRARALRANRCRSFAVPPSAQYKSIKNTIKIYNEKLLELVSGNRTRAAQVTIEHSHCAIEVVYCCFPRRCMYDFVRTWWENLSWGGGNPRISKCVPQRMTDCQSQWNFLY